MNALNSHQIILQICPEHLAVCKLSPTTPLPSWLEFVLRKDFVVET